MIGIDLAKDKQALAVVDHDVRVLARKDGEGEGVPDDSRSYAQWLGQRPGAGQ